MKIEMHAHTRETSPCAGIKAQTVVEEHIKAGYDAVVITDHFNHYVLEAKPEEDVYTRVERYLEGYRAALKAAEGTDLRVILGTEVCIYTHGPEDYLLYGVTEEFLHANPYMYNYNLDELRKACDEYDILLFQAHPGRPYLNMAPCEMLDGAEVQNGCIRHQNNNERVYKWAKENGLLYSSGSDYHQLEDIGRGGIITDRDVKNSRDLVDVLRSRNYTIINLPEEK